MLLAFVNSQELGISIVDLDSFDAISYDKENKILFGIAFSMGLEQRFHIVEDVPPESVIDFFNFFGAYWKQNRYEGIIYNWDLALYGDDMCSEDANTINSKEEYE